MVTFTTVNGKKIRLMVSEFTRISTELDMRDNGRRTSSTEKVSRLGMTARRIKESMLMVKSTGRVTSSGEIKVSTVASSSTIILKAMEFTNGVMAESTKGLG
jgi:hypothetical protein